MKKLLPMLALAGLTISSSLSAMFMALKNNQHAPYSDLSPEDQAAARPACRVLSQHKFSGKIPKAQDLKALNHSVAQISGRKSGVAHNARHVARHLTARRPVKSSEQLNRALEEVCPPVAAQAVEQVAARKRN